MIYETHAHYDDDAFKEDLEEVLNKVGQAGVNRIVNVSASMEGCKSSLELADKFPYIYASTGIHPSDTGKLGADSMDMLRKYARHDKVVAIGEIGLDYYWDEPDRDIQKKWFIDQLELARECQKPVIIHSRDAAADTYDIMKDMKASELGGVIHCFSYEVEMAKKYLDMGFYLGIGGVVTFKNGRKLKEVVEYAPIESLVTETDSPYLAPTPHRGERNDSSYIPLVIDEIARIKGIDREKTEEILYNNALKLYRQQA